MYMHSLRIRSEQGTSLIECADLFHVHESHMESSGAQLFPQVTKRAQLKSALSFYNSIGIFGIGMSFGFANFGLDCLTTITKAATSRTFIHTYNFKKWVTLLGIIPKCNPR